MNPEEWKQNILRAVQHIGSRHYQEDSWFGKGKAVSSPEELYCELFDDYLFEEFLMSDVISLTEVQREKGNLLKEKLEKFYDIQGNDALDPLAVIDDPRWEDIRSTARIFLAHMGK